MNDPKPDRDAGPLLSALTAPGRWVERSRGLTRVSLALVGFLLMMLCALWIRHAASLNGLPAIAEPFDLAALRSSRPDNADNAFVLYQNAVRQVPPETIEQILLVRDDATHAADPYLQQFASYHRPALALFVEGSQRPDVLNHDDTTAAGVLALARLSLAEGERLQDRGDLAGAWNLYRASLRAGRHLGQRSGWSGRSLGIALQADSCDRIVRWGNERGIDHDLLKTAISDLEALDAMTPPDWLTLRYEYLATLDRLAASTPGQARPELRDSRRADAFLRNEPERSRRVLRLIFTNWLEEWSAPASERSAPVPGTPSLYDHPGSRLRLPPARLQEWYASSDLAAWSTTFVDFPSPDLTDSLADDLVLLSNLIVHLAERRYILDHDAPPTYPEGLLGLYLNRIPSHYLPSRPLIPENSPVPLDTAPLTP